MVQVHVGPQITYLGKPEIGIDQAKYLELVPPLSDPSRPEPCLNLIPKKDGVNVPVHVGHNSTTWGNAQKPPSTRGKRAEAQL